MPDRNYSDPFRYFFEHMSAANAKKRNFKAAEKDTGLLLAFSGFLQLSHGRKLSDHIFFPISDEVLQSAP